MVATTDLEAVASPKDWLIAMQFTHHGVTYGRGEPLPEMTIGEALAFEAQGALVRPGHEPMAQPRPQPADIETYFQTNDEMLLSRLVEHRPPLETLLLLQEHAVTTGRSRVLVAAIRAVAAYAEPTPTPIRRRKKQ